MRDKDFPYENLAYYGYDTIKKKRKEGLFISFLNNTQLRKIRMYFWKDSTVAGSFLRTKNHIT